MCLYKAFLDVYNYVNWAHGSHFKRFLEQNRISHEKLINARFVFNSLTISIRYAKEVKPRFVIKRKKLDKASNVTKP